MAKNIHTQRGLEEALNQVFDTPLNLWFQFTHERYKSPIISEDKPLRNFEYRLKLDKPYMLIAWSDEKVYEVIGANDGKELLAKFANYVHEMEWSGKGEENSEDPATQENIKARIIETGVVTFCDNSELDKDSSEGYALFVKGRLAGQPINSDITYQTKSREDIAADLTSNPIRNTSWHAPKSKGNPDKIIPDDGNME